MAAKKKASKKTTKSKNGIPAKLNEKRTKELAKYLKKIKPTKDPKYTIRVNRNDVAVDVYEIPRSYCRLNPYNGRFRSTRKRLVRLRRKAGIKTPEKFNVDDTRLPNLNSKTEKYYDKEKIEPMGGDVNQIRNMIKGIQPKDTEKVTKYKELKKVIEGSKEKSRWPSGVEQPGIILADGTYVNGNRRDCVLEDLLQKTKRKAFETVRVAICPTETTRLDVVQMELGEQESIDTRAKFNNIDAAEDLWEFYEAVCKDMGLSLKVKDTSKKGKGKEVWRKDIIKEGLDTVVGRDEDFGITLLNLYEVSKLVLRKLAGGEIQPDDLWRVAVEDEGVSGEVQLTIEDWAKTYYNATTPSDKNVILNQITWLVAENWFSQKLKAQDKEDKRLMKYGYQDVKRGAVPKVLGAKSKTFNKTWFSKHSVKNAKDLMEFDRVLHKTSIKKEDTENENLSLKLIGEIESKLETILDFLDDKSMNRKVATILKEGAAIERISQCKKDLDKISSITKAKAGQQKKKRKTGKKKTVKNKKKPVKRKRRRL